MSHLERLRSRKEEGAPRRETAAWLIHAKTKIKLSAPLPALKKKVMIKKNRKIAVMKDKHTETDATVTNY